MTRNETVDIYIAHRRDLVSYASRIVGDSGRAEDVVQEAFLRFSTATTERLLEEPIGYLYRIVRNLSLDLRRRLSLEAGHLTDGHQDPSLTVSTDRPSPEAELIARDDLRRVMEALEELPERTRIALEMHRFGGFKLREIAERLGISVSMAQVLVTEGVRHCQRRL